MQTCTTVTLQINNVILPPGSSQASVLGSLKAAVLKAAQSLNPAATLDVAATGKPVACACSVLS